MSTLITWQNRVHKKNKVTSQLNSTISNCLYSLRATTDGRKGILITKNMTLSDLCPERSRPPSSVSGQDTTDSENTCLPNWALGNPQIVHATPGHRTPYTYNRSARHILTPGYSTGHLQWTSPPNSTEVLQNSATPWTLSPTSTWRFNSSEGTKKKKKILNTSAKGVAYMIMF